MANMKFWKKMSWAWLFVAGLIAGCETGTMDNQGAVSLAELQGISPTPTPPTVTPDTGTDTDPGTSGDTDSSTGSSTNTPGTGTSTNSTTGSLPAEITGRIKWLNTDVSGWAETASMKASVSGGKINFPYSKSSVWPAVDGVNANPWAIVNIDGQWYAATFEWLRRGQTSKPVGVLDGSKGDHFKVAPLSSWRPRSGERFGIMVSGLARGGSLRNVKERSNISMVTWP